MSKILFHEEQRFNQWWLWLVLILVFGTVIALTIINRAEFSTVELVLTVVFTVGTFWSFRIFKLVTTITEEQINIHFYPLVKRKWKWSELKVAQVLDYGFVGGWGIRIWTGMGTVFNVRGSKGLHIKTHSKEYVIGTQKEEELRSSIAHLLK